MKSIEERADTIIYEPKDGHSLKACEVVAFAEGYELGATEQKAIDNRECETMVGYAANECKQVMIDKACKWLNEQLYTDDGGCLVSDRYQKINEFLAAFREAMED